MSVLTHSATPLDAVVVEARPGGMAADVWLRKDIEEDVADVGPDSDKAVEFWRAEETHFVVAGVPTVEEVTEDFDGLWEAHKDDGLTDSERLTALEQANADFATALMELGDLMGDEG